MTSSVDAIVRADDVVRRVEAGTSLLMQASQAERLQSQLEVLPGSSGADGSDLVVAADVLARLRMELKPLEQIPELQERLRALDTADTKLESMLARSSSRRWRTATVRRPPTRASCSTLSSVAQRAGVRH